MKAVVSSKFNSNPANREKKDILAVAQEKLNIRKVLLSTVRLFATYPSNTPNGPNLVYLKLKNILGKIDVTKFTEG
jgi:hypothetical protein